MKLYCVKAHIGKKVACSVTHSNVVETENGYELEDGYTLSRSYLNVLKNSKNRPYGEIYSLENDLKENLDKFNAMLALEKMYTEAGFPIRKHYISFKTSQKWYSGGEVYVSQFSDFYITGYVVGRNIAYSEEPDYMSYFKVINDSEPVQSDLYPDKLFLFSESYGNLMSKFKCFGGSCYDYYMEHKKFLSEI